MSDCPYFLIHPLLDTQDRWAAFLCEVADDTTVRAADFDPLLDDPHWPALAGRGAWLVPAAGDLAVPVDRRHESLVHVFRPLTPEDPDALPLHELQQALRQSQRPTALRCQNGTRIPTVGAWDYLLIPIIVARALPPYTLLGQAGKSQLIAIDLRTHDDLAWARQNNCVLASSENASLHHPQPPRADVSRLKMIELLALISRDADTSELEAVFRREAKLAYSLLRLANSPAMSPGRPISGFAHSIALLGRRQLQRWLQLLVYADPNDGRPANPLLQKAAARGRLLELLSLAEGEQANDQAFMVGTFSLLDGLLNLPLNEIVAQLPLPDDVRDALTRHQGWLGQCLSALILADQREIAAASARLAELGIAPRRFLADQLAALDWATQLPGA